MVNKQPIGMNYIVGSATTYQGNTPSFAVMSIDPETMLPVDYKVYAFDLEGANLNDEPNWYLKYNYRDYFNITDLSPQSWYNHSQLILNNEEVAVRYLAHEFVGGPGHGNGTDSCDADCRLQLYCETTSSEYADL